MSPFGGRLAVLKVLLGATLIIPASSGTAADRRLTEEAVLFRSTSPGVVTVAGEAGTGSGFLVDSTGIILTNDHVVGGAAWIDVCFNDSVRVEANLLASDPDRDVAAIRVSPDVVRGLPVLELAPVSDSMVYVGERVLAIGSPLNQKRILTAGIVSKVEPTAVITDVNINHGNSGGPLINMEGRVIGINTFLDPGSPNGPGISGSILISQVVDVLSEARSEGLKKPAPSRTLLPVAPADPFPTDSLRAVAGVEEFDIEPYRMPKAGDFSVLVSTPILEAWRSTRYDRWVSATLARRNRSERLEPGSRFRDWKRYVGGCRAVISVQITPRVGQTSGSKWLNVLGAVSAAAANSNYRPTYRYEFKGDFRELDLYRNGTLVREVSRYRELIPRAFAEASWGADYSMEDAARAGFYEYSSSVFAPDSSGFPKITLKIWGVDQADGENITLSDKTVRRVWADFSSFRHAEGTPEAVFSVQGRKEPKLYFHDAPVTVILEKKGAMIAAQRVQVWAQDMIKVTTVNGRAEYISMHKVRSIIGQDGSDWTHRVLAEGHSAP